MFNFINNKLFFFIVLLLLLFISLNIFSFNDSSSNYYNNESQQLISDSLSKENLSYDKINYNTSLSLYYANWCGHCNKFKPTWEQIKNQLNNSNINVLTIDCSGDSNDTSINKTPNGTELEGFPTIILSKNNKDIIYNGERNASSILNFIKQNS